MEMLTNDQYNPYSTPYSNRMVIATCDIVMLFFGGQGAGMITNTGELILFKHTSSIMEKWLNKEWFVQMKRAVYINMWYFQPGLVQKYVLDIDPKVFELMKLNQLAVVDIWEKVITVSPRFRKNVAECFKNRDQLFPICRQELFDY